MQCHHIRNLSNKNYIFHDFLSTQQRKLGVIIFGSVRFLSKKVTKPNLKKKNRNRTETGSNRFGSGFSVWLGFLGFGLVFSGFGSVFSGFGSVFFGVARLFRFGSVLTRFGSVLAWFFSSFFRFRFSSVFSVFFL